MVELKGSLKGARDFGARLVSLRVTSGTLARNSLLAMILNGTRVVAQATSLVLLARVLGPGEFGKFAGVAGVAVCFGSLSGLGTGLVMYEAVATGRAELGKYWRYSVRTTAWSAIAILVCGVVVTRGLLETTLPLIAVSAIMGADILFLPMLTNSCYALAAYERIGYSAGLSLSLAIARLLAVVTFWYFPTSRTIEGYAPFYFAATVLMAMVALAVVHRVLRPNGRAHENFSGTVRRGLSFVTVWATGGALGSIDKALVLRYAGAESAGIYTPAYRAATVLMFPLDSMNMAAMPRLFQKFGAGRAHRGLLGMLLLITIVYGLAVTVLLWFSAPLLPVLLGDKFAATVHALHWMSLFVPCYALRVLGGSVLMTAGMMKQRATVEVLGILAMVALAMLVLQKEDWISAAIMITLVEAVVAALHWSLILGSGITRAAVDIGVDR